MKWRINGTEKVFQFKGAYEHHVKLTLFPTRVKKAGHVVVLPRYKDTLLMTKHRTRGIEWPGGKVEEGETPLQAAIREVREETGGIISSLWLVGQYEVRPTQGSTFQKNIYVAEVSNIDQHKGEDTYGPVLVPLHVQPTIVEGYSPLVTDSVFKLVQQSVMVINEPTKS